MTKIHKIFELINFVESQDLFQNFKDQNFYLSNLFNNPTTLSAKINYLNNKFPEYNGDIFPIYHCNGDDYICVIKDSYYYVNSEISHNENFNIKYNSPEEVWLEIHEDIKLFHNF